MHESKNFAPIKSIYASKTLNLSNIDPSPVEELLKLSLNKLEFDPSEHTEKIG